MGGIFNQLLNQILMKLFHHAKHVPVELTMEAIKRYRDQKVEPNVEDLKSLLAKYGISSPAEMPASEAEKSKGKDSPSSAGTVPVDGKVCPSDYPIKGSAKKIYHVPGGRFYAETSPVRCFATKADAEAAGFRASRR
ncbi:MAG TPA: hypothetical protein VKA60_12610 [Blastocatellia bacterium]|nr:hypothetical protein [Blastocatellia bacterium]